MPHLDGPMFYPTICTISLGSHTVLDFYKEKKNEDSDEESRTHVTSLLVKPRSLLVLKQSMYHDLLHGIREASEDEIHDKICNLNSDDVVGDKIQRSTRVSLTIRHVPKTSKMKFKIGK